MATLFLIIGIALLVITELPSIPFVVEKWSFLMGLVLTVLFGISVVINLFIFGISLRVDEKIQIYEEENAQIEASIDAAVKAYCEHEQITYTKMADGAIALVAAAYPELASSELVRTQMDIWTSNCAELKKLKSQEVDLESAKWFLYFGGNV